MDKVLNIIQSNEFKCKFLRVPQKGIFSTDKKQLDLKYLRLLNTSIQEVNLPSITLNEIVLQQRYQYDVKEIGGSFTLSNISIVFKHDRNWIIYLILLDWALVQRDINNTGGMAEGFNVFDICGRLKFYITDSNGDELDFIEYSVKILNLPSLNFNVTDNTYKTLSVDFSVEKMYIKNFLDNKDYEV